MPRPMVPAPNNNGHVAAVNCCKNLTSFSLNNRISLIPYFSNAGRSIPIPNAKPVYLLWIDAAVLQHLGMNHSATQNFKPARSFTNTASFTITKQATDIHFGTGLGKRKITWPETDFHILAKHFLHKKIKVCFRSANETFSSIYNPSTW